jgi:hypothetical protein
MIYKEESKYQNYKAFQRDTVLLLYTTGVECNPGLDLQ